jgi:hypothetical protein
MIHTGLKSQVGVMCEYVKILQYFRSAAGTCFYLVESTERDLPCPHNQPQHSRSFGLRVVMTLFSILCFRRSSVYWTTWKRWQSGHVHVGAALTSG